MEGRPPGEHGAGGDPKRGPYNWGEGGSGRDVDPSGDGPNVGLNGEDEMVAGPQVDPSGETPKVGPNEGP